MAGGADRQVAMGEQATDHHREAVMGGRRTVDRRGVATAAATCPGVTGCRGAVAAAVEARPGVIGCLGAIAKKQFLGCHQG